MIAQLIIINKENFDDDEYDDNLLQSFHHWDKSLQ